MDEVWTATANFSAYLDPDDLRPAFHGRLSRNSQVTVRLLPLSEEQLEQSKEEFVDRITALSRCSFSSCLISLLSFIPCRDAFIPARVLQACTLPVMNASAAARRSPNMISAAAAAAAALLDALCGADCPAPTC